MAAAVALAVVYGLVDYFPYEAERPSHAEAVAYSSVGRIAWASVIAWVVVACHYGYGGKSSSPGGATTDYEYESSSSLLALS
jgi:hypothetical protein